MIGLESKDLQLRFKRQLTGSAPPAGQDRNYKNLQGNVGALIITIGFWGLLIIFMV